MPGLTHGSTSRTGISGVGSNSFAGHGDGVGSGWGAVPKVPELALRTIARPFEGTQQPFQRGLIDFVPDQTTTVPRSMLDQG